MIYSNIVKGKFISRPNRFIAIVDIDGHEEKVHVKNTGRCKELLIPGATVYMEDFKNRMGTRKLRYSLISVFKEKGKLVINMDSQSPNKVVMEALKDGTIKLPNMSQLSIIKGEQKYKNSRFDFYVEDANGKKGYIEVKGVTLEKDGIVRFPDAPTERGVKHLHELMDTKLAGFEAYAIFVVQIQGMKLFTPNYETHREFAETLIAAKNAGVHILAYDCSVSPDTLTINKQIPIKLEEY